MKRIRNLVIGGIQSKIFNLILITVILLSAANYIVHTYQSGVLAQLSAESSEAQQSAITNYVSSMMDDVVYNTLSRSNRSEALIADKLFAEAGDRIAFLADYLTEMFAHPENYLPRPVAGPDPATDGEWTAKAIYVDGVDPADPVVAGRLGLVGNMSEMLIAMCPALGAANVYIALPEGVHYTVSTISSSWYVDGKPRSYDPRTRDWYQKAAQAGGVIFTDGEADAITGTYCVECAAPVYGPDGSLRAVIGTDLFLDEMQRVMRSSLPEGESLLLVNQNGRAVLGPQEAAFPMADADHGNDLRQSELQLLSRVISEALAGNDTGVMQGMLKNGEYYITGTPIPSTGWVLLSVYSKKIAGQPAAIMRGQNQLIQNRAANSYRTKTKKSNNSATVLLAAVTLLMLAGALTLGRRIVKPLNTITRRISELSETNLEFKMEDAFRTGDEVEELAQSFADISHKTVQYLDTVKRVSAEKERISTELGMATQIQFAMLPHIVPAFPDRTEFDIYASMDPAKEVGGDFYDYFLIDDDHLCMVIADVSGKGVPAALFMMASKIILQSVAMLGKSPAEILAKTNEAICSNNEAQMFVTVWLGILEISTGKLTAANAGHEYPVLRRPDGNYELYKDKHGFVIGGLEGARYKEYELSLEPGAKLFVYTDGVPEATNAEKELFGTDRMLESLNAHPDATPIEVLKAMRRAVDGFVKDAEQFDDLTMLCLEYKGAAAKGEGQA